MIVCMCLVQAGQISPLTEAALRARLDAFSQKAFGSPTQVNWIAVPEGSGFTAAKPSTSAVVVMRAPTPVEQPLRVTLLKDLCDLWTKETGCSIDEVVGVISDPPAN